MSANAISAGLITTTLTVGNVCVGFVFQAFIASRLGTSHLSDKFQLAWAIVTFGALVFLSLVPILLVPRMFDHVSATVRLADQADIWAIGALFACAQFVLSLGMGEGALSDTLFWSAPSHLLASMAASSQATAYVQRRFALAGCSGLLNGLGLLAFSASMSTGGLTATELGVALSAGYFVQVTVTSVLVLRRLPQVSWTRAMPRTSILGVVGFALLTKFQPVLERVLTVGSPEGTTAVLGFGQKVAQGLVMVGAFGLALTATASLARLVIDRQYHAAGALVGRTFLLTTVATSVALLTFTPLSWITVRLVFVRGEFSEADALMVFTVVALQSPWVVASALTGVLTSFLYIERRYIGVAIASVAGLLMTAGSSWGLSGSLNRFNVPAASSIGAVTTLVVATALVRRSPVWAMFKDYMLDHRVLVVLATVATVTSSSVLIVAAAAEPVREALVPLGTVVAIVSTCVATTTRSTRNSLGTLRRAVL